LGWTSNCSASCATVRSPLTAASATFALKAGVWFRRARLLIVAPDSQAPACPLSGRNSTYRPVQNSGTGSAELTRKQIQRGVHTSVRQLEADIRTFIDLHNKNPKPFKWTKSADQILASVKRFCHKAQQTLCGEL